MCNHDYIYAGFTKGGGTDETPNWKLIPNTDEAREEALRTGYNAFSIMSLSHDPEKNKLEPLRKGPLILDFDFKGKPEAAIKVARKFLEKLLLSYQLHADCLRYWLSGAKGCHIEIPASVMGSEEGHPYLHVIYKFMVFLLHRECFGYFFGNRVIDLQMYCGGKGRLLREENIRRQDNGRYKVPVSSKEFFELDYDTLWELTSQPRKEFETGHKTGVANPGLVEKYNATKAIIESRSIANPISILNAMSKCAFFCKCVDNAETLEEPAWWAFISNLVPLQELGRKLVHYFSRPYPGYSIEETDRKFMEGVKSGMRKTCDYIRQQGWAECPRDCQMRAPCDLFRVRNNISSIASFVHNPDGLHHSKDGRLIKVCSPIKVVARGCDFENWGWCRVLELTDQMGQTKRLILPMKEFADTGNKWFTSLLSGGLVVEPFPKAKMLLKEYIEHGEPDCDIVRISDKIGWMPDGGYLLPDNCIGSDRKAIFAGSLNNAFQVSGILEEWQEKVGKYCAENSLLVFVTSYALTGVMLELIGCEGGGLHIYGGSSKGKSTIAVVAGSVCGGGKEGFIHQWRTTDNALERIAASHNDNFLVLDEVGQVSSVALSNLAYMLPNQKGKLRMKADGQNRQSFSWNLNFLSTGELTIADKIAEDARLRFHAGQEIRIIDLPVDGGGFGEKHGKQLPFTELHGVPGAREFSDLLKRNARAIYGAPMRVFLEKIIADKRSVVQSVGDEISEFIQKNMPENAGGQVQRALKKFALIAATGELAIELGIFPYAKGEARKSAKMWFNIWIRQRNGTEDAEILAALKRIGEYLASSNALYMNIDDARYGSQLPARTTPGYRYGEGADTVYFILQDRLRELIGNVNMRSIIQRLNELGCLERTRTGSPREFISINSQNMRGLGIIASKLP